MRVTRCSSSATAATTPPNGGGASVNSGASSSLTRSPVGAYANAMLCATTRRAPVASAASTRTRVPSVRTRLFASNTLGSAQSIRGGSEVSWWITASGEASAMAARTPSASNTSQTTGSAPTASSCAARRTERVIAVTSCPASSSCGTSGVPITPVAPARNTRIACTSVVVEAKTDAVGGGIRRPRVSRRQTLTFTAAASRMRRAVAAGCATETACDAPGISIVRCAPARSAM